MIEKSGDMFTSTLVCLGHGVNTQGVMGAGVARVVRDLFPANYESYREHCEKKTLLPGGVLMVPDGNRQIYNMASQMLPGPDANYVWLFDAAYKAAKIARRHGYHAMAIPQIGCGIGGLHWDRVKLLLEAIEILVPKFEWEVWTL